VVHDPDPIGDRHRLLLVMGDDDEGQTKLLLQLHQLELRLPAQLLVERRERLVEQQDARALHQGARQRHALALAAGKLVRLASGEAFEPHQRQHLFDPGSDLRPGKPLLLETERDIALDREVGKQRVALEHHVDRPPIGRHTHDILPVEQDASGVRRLEARKQTQQRGLAAARGAEQRKKFPREDVERHALDRGDAGEMLAHAVEAHQHPRRRIRPRRERAPRVLPACFVAGVGLAIPHDATLEQIRNTGATISVRSRARELPNSPLPIAARPPQARLKVRATASRHPAHLRSRTAASMRGSKRRSHLHIAAKPGKSGHRSAA
jgi:hypothetical protein